MLVESQPVRAWNAGRDMRLTHSFSKALLDSMHFNASLTEPGCKESQFFNLPFGQTVATILDKIAYLGAFFLNTTNFFSSKKTVIQVLF